MFLLCFCSSGGKNNFPRFCGSDLSVTGITHPDPVLPGSKFTISGTGFDYDCAMLEVHFSGNIGSLPVDFLLVPENVTINSVSFNAGLDLSQLFAFGGIFTGEIGIRLSYSSRIIAESSLSVSFETTRMLQPSVESAFPVDLNFNAPVTIHGSNFIYGEEGTTWAELNGMFTTDESLSIPVTGVRLPVNPIEEIDRRRGFFIFSPSIAGISPGSFEGSLKLINENLVGTILSSNSIQVFFHLGPSFITKINPSSTTLGGIIMVEGAGFIGATYEEVMTFLLNGTAYPYGKEPVEVNNKELIGRYIDWSRIAYDIIPVKMGDHLEAMDFGFNRGTFSGSITPILEFRGEKLQGLPTNVEFQLGPVKQVVYIKFSDNFPRTLKYFGLKAAEQYVKDAILDKLRRTYEGINVEFRTEQPKDYYPGGYAIVEISGPDPNGKGLFGYDNTPGKDVWNLRLEDRIGGLNAETQFDGYPGYGGIFVDSIMCWSNNVPEEIVCPEGFQPSPLFDHIFDPIRKKEVVAGEYPSGSDAQRVSQIREAIRVLGNIIGDSAAHELGHSLGLAHPFGPPDLVHNEPPGPGCLMDAGSYRPFEERAELNGVPPGGWCGDELSYLQMILPVH